MDLTLADFVLYALLGSCAFVVFCAVVSRTLHVLAEGKSVAKRVVCRLCLHAFEDEGRERVVRCPACGAANEKGRCRRLG